MKLSARWEPRNQLTPFGNSASTLQTILQVFFPVFTIEYCVHATNVCPYCAKELIIRMHEFQLYTKQL